MLCFQLAGVTKIRNIGLLKAFGKRLRELRGIKGLTQEELSYRADVPLSQIGRIERGEINPTLSTIAVLAEALEVHQSELINF
jgi:transcriptional regulator with XRE-family HTH domain